MNEDTPLPGGPSRLDARERFLAEFMRAWLEGRDLPTLVAETARRLRAILEVDRLTVSVLRESEGTPRLVAQATDSAPGVPPLPETLRRIATDGDVRERIERTFWTDDVLEEPLLGPIRDAFRAAGTRAMLFVPIRIAHQIRGGVTATTLREHPRTFRPGEAAFLETAVGYLSAALRDAELVQQLSRERDRQRVLFDVAAAVQQAGTVPRLVETVLSRLREPLGFPIGIFGLLGPDGQAMEAAGGYGGAIDGGHPLPPIPLAGGGSPPLAALALAAEEPIVVADVASDPRAAGSRDRLAALGAASVAVVALRAGGRPLGILMVGCDGDARRIEPDDVTTLRSLAGFVSVALDQRRSAEAAERATREANALSEASRALLTRTASRDVLLDQVIEAVAVNFRGENCRLLLVDREQQALVDVARRGDWVGLTTVPPLPLAGRGLTVAAARDGTIVNVPDVSKDPRYLEGWENARSELAVPLRIDDEVVGVVDLQGTRLAAFGPEDVRLLSAFADRAALAVRLAELVGALEDRTRVLEAVSRATRVLNFRLQAPDLLAVIAEETGRAFPAADGCAVLVADDAGKTLMAAATYGVGDALAALAGGAAHPIDFFPFAGRAFLEDRPVFRVTGGVEQLLSDQTPETRQRVRVALGGRDLRYLLAVPIRVGSGRLGVLELISSGPHPFDARDAETLLLLADHAAIALRNARTMEELQRSNRLKDDFLANLSHEVRTPLTGIVGWSEVLLDARGDDPETRRALHAILAQAETLSRMLTDLIDLSRIDNFGLELRRVRVSLAEVTRNAVEAVAPAAAKRTVALETDVPEDLPILEADPGRLQQVVWNLLTNAIKFSPPGSSVRVEGRADSDGGLTLAVEDRGSGIDPAFLPFVFDRFRQEETAFNRRFGGLGVGLAIARAIVEAHDGTISATSEGRDRGCRFVVRFPRSRVERPSGAFRRPGLPPSPRGRTLLLAEPDSSHRVLVAGLCESLGYDTTSVPGAGEAIAAAARLVPDVLLADLALADGPDGLVRRMRSLPGADRTRWVALADGDGPEVRRLAAEAGFREVVPRPARRVALERALAPPGEGEAGR